jgi:hypothetical protein
MKHRIIFFVTLAVGFLAGATALSALAAGTWTAPTAPPPGGNVDAPLNVGSTAQAKTGLLGLSSFLFNPTGTANITPGSVLTAADANGDVGWGNISSSAVGIDYAFTYIQGSPNYNFPIVCRMNTSNGYTECKQSGDIQQTWTSIPSPFAAATPSTYSLMCVAGSGGYNYASCCRLNVQTGSMECKTTTASMSSWISVSNPF